MNSSTSNAEQAVSFDFLVKVTEDKLELQHDLLQSLLVPYTNNEVPVAIVTVIGQPKSRKTLLTNLIQNCIIRLVGTESKKCGTAVTPTSGFPRSLDDCPSKSVRDKLDGQDGVLIWTKPCLVQQKDGQSLAVFILDIWSENPSPSIYTKLVDFCVTSSSMVILVEDCCVSKELNWNHWDISKSFLAQLKGREFQNLHVLIHANWEEENFHTLGLEGGKLFMKASKDRFSERLSRITDTARILRGYFQDSTYFLAQLKSESTIQNDKIYDSDSDHIRGLLEFTCKVIGCDPSKLLPLARNKTILSTLSVDSHFQNGIVISNNSVTVVTKATDATMFHPNNIKVEMELCEGANGNAEVSIPIEAESKKSPTDAPTNFEARAAAAAEVENQSSLVDEMCVKSLKQGGHLVEAAYLMKLRSFINNSLEMKLFFKDEDLESLHLQFKRQIWDNFSSQFPSSQDDGFHDTVNTKFDKIFTDFRQENSDNRRLYYLHLQEGQKNSKLKFGQITAKLRIHVLENPLEIVYDLGNDYLDSYYERFTEHLPVKWKHYFSLWYLCKADEFKIDFDSMKAMIKFYKEKMQRLLISSRCKTKNEFEEAHMLYSENADEMAINRKWNYKTLNDIAKEAIVLLKQTFARCIDLTHHVREVHKKGLKTFIDSHSNNNSLYFEDDQLNSLHSKLKAKIEQPDVASRIPPSLVDILLAKMKTDCDEIFSSFMTKYSEERLFFYNFLEQVKLKTKLKFDEEVAMLKLQIKKDPSNLSYDPRKANLNHYVKALTRDMTNSKWRSYFISWYSHELDDFTKDLSATISAIQLYRDKFKSFFGENICVKENEFHEAHNTFAKLAAEDNNHTWKNSRLKVLSGIGIELTKHSFNQLNLDIINKEEEMAKQASIFAEEHYNSLMKSQISERTFTDSEVKTFHETCVKTAVDSFHGVPQFKDAYVWDQYLNELGNRLKIHLSSYLKENQQNVDRVQQTKKNVMSDCTKVYNDTMNKLIADRVISDKILRSYHDRSTEEVLQTLNVRMNSIKEKFDKNSWAKELAEKLRMCFNDFAEENNRKIQNEAKNNQPAGAASIDCANAGSTQSCGVGIYFGPDIVRLGTYANPQTNPKYLEFSPFVTFERNEIVFFKPHSSRCDHFDVYQTLVKVENFQRTVFVSGKSYQLWIEEIVAVFLNKIKSVAETKFGFAITSCTVAVSAFMSTSSKHMLKTALTLAGFERSTIIQSTTAVGLSYVVTNKVSRNSPAIFIHQAGSVFDVAIAVINQTSISIRCISGLPYLKKSFYLSKLLGTTGSRDTLSGRVKQLISGTLAASGFSALQLKAQVTVQGKENFTSDKSAITDPLLGRPLTTLDEAQGIVLGAAAFNAFQNKFPGAPNLEYSEVFPYTFTAEVNEKQMKNFVRHNMPVISSNLTNRLSLAGVSNWMKVRITERAGEVDKMFVGEYTINAVNSKCRNFFLFVTFNYEGLIEVEAQTADLKTFPVQIRTNGLTMAQQCTAVKNLRPILIPTAAPCRPNVPVKSEEVKTNAGAVEHEITPPLVVAQDSKAKLVNMIADVKDRLEKSTITNPMMLDRINERIKECEELLEKDM